MLTIDRLIEILMTEETDDAGMRAVVRALRDEIDRIWIDEDMGCGTILDVFNQILGDAGDEVVGGSANTVDAQQCQTSTPSPATDPCPRCGYPAQDQCDSPGCNIDPAPDVCEWRDDAYIGCFTTSCSDDAAWNRLGGTPKDEGYNFCPSCGKPIKFTEAKT